MGMVSLRVTKPQGPTPATGGLGVTMGRTGQVLMWGWARELHQSPPALVLVPGGAVQHLLLPNLLPEAESPFPRQ